jgi:ethanolamine ammonia-lyase large subunit
MAGLFKMHQLISLGKIAVPRPKRDKAYQCTAPAKYIFHGLKALLGAADVSKAGDRNANLAAKTETMREAARGLLSQLTLQHLYDHPLTDDDGHIDSIMRINYAIDLKKFGTLASLTLGELKDLLLRSNGEEIKIIGRALTGVMIAAVAKLLDVHELIFIARKIECRSEARTVLGQRGVLASRLQPNHPTDDLRGLTLLTYAGLSIGSGDALIGVNPAIDTVENVSTILRHLDQLRRKTGAPTQICVLSHIKTQMACLELGVPVEIMFQSLAGTESTLLTEFDVSIDLLDRAYLMMKERGPLGGMAKQFMYFETGQGSEFTYGKHNGIDMATTEALCYGLARRYDPFMVNNVTGFIGPETHLDNFEMVISNLQDHFMGKLMGLPMGMAPCYTLHSKILLEGQQMATELLTAAGANYYMDVCLNTDRMLAYFDTSGHDNQTLREIHGKTTTPAFLDWALEQGIFTREKDGIIVRGPNWGNVRRFCSSDMEFSELARATPAFYEFNHSGPRPVGWVSRQLRMNQAVSRDAITSELEPKRILLPSRAGNSARSSATKTSVAKKYRIVETGAKSKEAHLNSPDLGAHLSASTLKKLKPSKKQLQIVISDGLSAEAVHFNVPTLMSVLEDGFNAHGVSMGQHIVARYGRVKLGEEIATRVRADLTIVLIGERPGGDADSARSLSAYLLYQLKNPIVRREAAAFSCNSKMRFEYTVISNIYSPGGLPPAEAGSVIVEKCQEILSHRAAGNRLEALLKAKSAPQIRHQS